MPIKLSDLTCEKCIYSHFTQPSAHTYNGYWNCRKHHYPMSTDQNYWCGEGKWLTKLSELEPYMTRERYFLICNEALVRDEIIDPHEA